MIDISLAALTEAICLAALLAYAQYACLRAGVFSLAPVGIALLGAYTAALLEVRVGMPVLAASLIAVVAGILSAAFLGALVSRLRGIYQAIATLSFVIVMQEGAQTWDTLTLGTFGVNGIPRWASAGPLVVLTLVVIVLAAAVDYSRIGRQLSAARMDEQAAAAVGVDVARLRLFAFLLSGVIGSIAGIAIAGNQYFISPGGFGFSLLIATLSIVVIGGYRSWPGPLVGAILLTLLPQIFKSLANYQSLVSGALLVLVVLFLPDGIAGGAVRGIKALSRQLRFNRWFERRRRRALAEQAHDAPVASLVPVGTADEGETPYLELRAIARSFSGVKAVADVSLTVRPGEIVGLIGPNGAGKSTVVNLASGVARLDSGVVILSGQNIETWPAYRIARTGLTRTFQTCRLFPEFSVLDNMLLAPGDSGSSGRLASLRGLHVGHANVQRAFGLLRRMGVEQYADRKAVSLPYADQRRVEIARALTLNPRFLLLDEPAAGMSDSEAESLGALVREVAASGLGVLIIDHNVNWVLSLCDRIAVQHMGAVIAEGPPAQVRSDDAVIAAYLG